jgi:arylsulfatase A-like enzyme
MTTDSANPAPLRRRLLRAAVLIASLALLAAALLPTQDDTDIRRVVVIHLDTTRTDDLSCYGGPGRTPNIDAVAARGMRYANSVAPLPKTSPSIASFMTGRLSNRHGVYDVGGRLANELTTLPELLKAQGFVTGGFVSNPVVDRLKSDGSQTAGFDQGFDVFEGVAEPPELEGPVGNAIPRMICNVLVEKALRFVEAHAEERFFLWMLHVDPHASYAPPPPYDAMYLDDPAIRAGSVRLDPEQIHHDAYVAGRVDSHEYVARHLGEVTMTDRWLGLLLRRLEALPGRTLLVITADHGESLGDDGYWFGHGANIRHPCVNVPLVIACDGVVPIGNSQALVANVDLAPTILDLLGIPAEPLLANGMSLRSTFHEADPWPERMVPLQAYMGTRWRGVRSARWSLQSEFDPADGQRLRTMLYDMINDPRETSDVSAAQPDVLEVHMQLEEAWFGQEAWPAADLSGDPEMARRLRTLGYLK